MHLSFEFPSVMYREGAAAVLRLAQAVEQIGFDQLDIFDHVTMAHPVAGRTPGPYPPKMPILEALMTLSFFAAATERIGLGTEVLVLPQRHPTLTARQVATLDTLSGGRVRLGVGVGWQAEEYESLGVPFEERGARMDEAIVLLRKAWSEDPVEHQGRFYSVHAMALEPKPPQGADLPIWIGGESPVALRRAGRLGDGWMAVRAMADLERASSNIATIKQHAEDAGRDPERLGFQSQISPPPQKGSNVVQELYSEPQNVASAAARLRDAGFDGVAINGTGLFQAGHRDVDSMIEGLGLLHETLRSELGR